MTIRIDPITISRAALFAVLFAAFVVLAGCATTGEPDPDQRYATLVTGFAPPSSRAHAVEVSRIDGRSLNLGDFDPQLKRFENGRTSHRVKPGMHEIHGIPIINDTFGGFHLSRVNRSVLPLVHNFESGTRYYLAVARSEVDSRRWQVTIWKQQETDAGLLDLE